VVKFVLAMHEPRVRFTAATSLFLLFPITVNKDTTKEAVCGIVESKTFGLYIQVVTLEI
jgi:hypothetical protein